MAEATKPSSGSSTGGAISSIFALLWTLLAGYGVYIIGQIAYRIRLRAIEDYGPVIHEFDPYFNYRATEVSKLSACLLVVNAIVCVIYLCWRCI